MSNRYDSVLFDLDGTLTDSGPGIMRCAALAMDALHIPYENTPVFTVTIITRVPGNSKIRPMKASGKRLISCAGKAMLCMSPHQSRKVWRSRSSSGLIWPGISGSSAVRRRITPGKIKMMSSAIFWTRSAMPDIPSWWETLFSMWRGQLIWESRASVYPGVMAASRRCAGQVRQASRIPWTSFWI